MNNFTLRWDVCEVTPIEARGNKGRLKDNTTDVFLTHFKKC